MSPEKVEPARWFAEEVHPHERALRSYVQRSFPSVRDVDDVVQESYLRVWTARALRPIVCGRGFLFTVARHLALDLVRRDRATPIDQVGDLAAIFVVEGRPNAADALTTKEKIQFVAEAVASLPTRCREVVILRKFQGISQRDVAAQLGISEKTVEVQVARGMSRCEHYLRSHGVQNPFGDE